MIVEITRIAIIIVATYFIAFSLYGLFVIFKISINIEPRKEQPPMSETKKEPQQPEVNSSIIGSSKCKLYPLPTQSDSERQGESTADNVTKFAPDDSLITAPIEQEYATREEEEEEVNEEDVDVAEMGYDENQQASGVAIPEIQEAATALHKTLLSQSEKQRAGEIFYKLEGTEIANQLLNDNDGVKMRVRELLKSHMEIYNREHKRYSESSDEQLDFNIYNYI